MTGQQIAPMAGDSSPAECSFCRIISGDLNPGVCLPVSPAFAVFPADRQRPGNQGHMILAPRLHLLDLQQLPAALAEPLLWDLQLVDAAVQQAFAATGTTIRINRGQPGQSIAHLHAHIIPRYTDDAFTTEKSVPVPPEQRLLQIAALAPDLRSLRALADIEEGL